MGDRLEGSALASKIPDDLWYTRDHLWLRMEDGMAIIGLTDHAQGALGEVVGIELPEKGASCDVAEEVGVVESTSTSVEVLSPVSGRVLEVNRRLERMPHLINRDPYGMGWLARIRVADPRELDELLDPEDYCHVLNDAH